MQQVAKGQPPLVRASRGTLNEEVAMPDSINDHIRVMAAEAQYEADKAETTEERENWLQISREWLALILPELGAKEGGLTIELWLPTTPSPTRH